MDKLRQEIIQNKIVGEEDKESDKEKLLNKIWNKNIEISPKEYFLISRERLESVKSDNVFQKIKNDLLEFAKTVKILIKGEQLPLYNIEKDSAFFEFLVESVRDFKTLLLELEPFNKKPSLGGYCNEASSSLAHWLNHQIKNRFPNEVAEAVVVAGDFLPFRNSHFWVQIGHTIVDISVHQFKDSMELQKSKVLEEINKETTEEGIFISNDEKNILYRNYVPRTIYDVKNREEMNNYRYKRE